MHETSSDPMIKKNDVTFAQFVYRPANIEHRSTPKGPTVIDHDTTPRG